MTIGLGKMQKIRLAYDISPLGLYFSWPDSKTGIYRVAEEILYELLEEDTLDITLMGLCGEALAYTNVGCQKYFINRKEGEKTNINFGKAEFATSYKSRLNIKWLYSILYGRYFSKRFQKKSKKSLESLLVRAPLKAIELTKLERFDTYRIFDPTQYDLLHSTYFKVPPRELTQDIPRLITIYDLIPLTAKEFVDPNLNSYFFETINSIDHHKDWVTCISEYTRQEFCDYTGFPKERTFVSYLGADSAFGIIDDKYQIDSVRQSYGIKSSNYFLCLASHLDPRKNIFHLIKTFVRLIRENPRLDVSLVLIGTLRFQRRDVEAAFQEFADYMEQIVFTGYVPDADLNTIYNGATAFVFPSLYEGFGLPILEAMQAGVPVISSNSTSLPEVAGDAAILVDPKDETALCQSMLDVFRDDDLRQQLSQKGLVQARKFSWKKCAGQTVEIYREILDRNL
ncbi:glycosyltransferase family 4 protein [Leptothoe spongobia]|uniref:Glycosyltransferase family 4 protein n=1 Tax=Leptothoe spongobia TAU-MAC 1115 TaxID=1967444 RepID=A0A947DF34_9CYAN|nr:glycosyltransferase family 1 protein [Leptothoe spongobia]MBT9315239.1 glycosyltransferase family 4 protein [Leptothoe spongobia TAU-MAC 1115]